MEDNLKIEWEQLQKENWKKQKNDLVASFKRFNLDISDIYNQVMSIDYNRMQEICYLLGKIDKAIKICDFLDILERDNHEDVDIIKIYILISHAEITSRSFGKGGPKIDIVKNFFSPVKSFLEYKIIPTFPSTMDFADILYKIRCQYVHEGEYLGKIFKENKLSVNNIFTFKDYDKELGGSCGITYKEFIDIYIKALFENIKIFSEHKKEL